MRAEPFKGSHMDALINLVAWLTAGMGIVSFLSAIRPSVGEHLYFLERFLPFAVRTAGHLASALFGFALLLLSMGLHRRKQVSWLLTLVILGLSVPVHLLKGRGYVESALALSLISLLIYLRPHFHARSDPPSVRQGIIVLLAAFLFTLTYGVIGFYLLDHHFKVRFDFWAAVRQTIVMFTQFYNPDLQPIPLTRFGRYFSDSIYIVGVMTIGYALFMLLRPVLYRQPPSAEERERAWQIVRNYGRSALARIALLDDKIFFFSPGGSLISFVVENGVALSLGDPIGPSDDVPGAIQAFQVYCRKNDWLPAFYQVMPDYLEIYAASGFRHVMIGEEGIVDLPGFTLEGGENKKLRNTYNKLVRLGYHSQVLYPPYSARLLWELNSISESWLSAHNTVEMRFSVGWFDENYINSCPVLVVRDREGFIEAFANIVEEFQKREVTVDLMRYRTHAESGIMDFLFVSLFLWAREQGYERFNLGLSALSGVGEHSDDPVVERALRFIYRHVDQFYNFRGLHSFKEKFHPVWHPRYLIYPGASSLPAVSIALLRANLGGRLFALLGGYFRQGKSPAHSI